MQQTKPLQEQSKSYAQALGGRYTRTPGVDKSILIPLPGISLENGSRKERGPC